MHRSSEPAFVLTPVLLSTVVSMPMIGMRLKSEFVQAAVLMLLAVSVLMDVLVLTAVGDC